VEAALSDFLVELGSNALARKVIRQLGLPVPLPEALRRESGPWTAQPLTGMRVGLGRIGPGFSGLESLLARAGASIHLDEAALNDALVFDATTVPDLAALSQLFAFFQPRLQNLGRSGRVVLLASAPLNPAPELAAALQALDGFTRSVAKEIGKRGATANLVRLAPGAEDELDPVLRFLLSPRSAFISGQPLLLTRPRHRLPDPPSVQALAGKTALVTGAARGIGEATARLLAQEGAKLLLLDRPGDGALTRLAAELGGKALELDLAEATAAQTIVQQVKTAGGLDVLVHNAGITRDKTLARMRPEHYLQVMEVNLAAVVRVTAALEDLLHDHARIVCLSSVAGIAGNVGQTAYAASKAGIIGFVRAQAERLAPRGITVNAIAPGFIETQMTARMPFAIREIARRLSALSQGGLPEDVGQAVIFLASPGAQGLNGQLLRVCGGALVGA
jgi:3-oxoacyl-[acyl-carrier protein] reductase